MVMALEIFKTVLIVASGIKELKNDQSLFRVYLESLNKKKNTWSWIKLRGYISQDTLLELCYLIKTKETLTRTN